MTRAHEERSHPPVGAARRRHVDSENAPLISASTPKAGILGASGRRLNCPIPGSVAETRMNSLRVGHRRSRSDA